MKNKETYLVASCAWTTHPWQNAVFTWFFNQRPPSLGGILFKYFSIYVNYVLII